MEIFFLRNFSLKNIQVTCNNDDANEMFQFTPKNKRENWHFDNVFDVDHGKIFKKNKPKMKRKQNCWVNIQTL